MYKFLMIGKLDYFTKLYKSVNLRTIIPQICNAINPVFRVNNEINKSCKAATDSSLAGL